VIAYLLSSYHIAGISASCELGAHDRIMSSPSAISNLSDELLLAIFESLLGRERPKLGVPLLSVCELWGVRGISIAQTRVLMLL
jgi:hypothetical protein